MVKYKLQIERRCLKDLEKVPKQFRKAITEKLEELEDDPRPSGSIKQSGSRKVPLYRILIGDYRLLYSILDDQLIVLVVELGHRKEIYRVLCICINNSASLSIILMYKNFFSSVKLQAEGHCEESSTFGCPYWCCGCAGDLLYEEETSGR